MERPGPIAEAGVPFATTCSLGWPPGTPTLIGVCSANLTRAFNMTGPIGKGHTRRRSHLLTSVASAKRSGTRWRGGDGVSLNVGR